MTEYVDCTSVQLRDLPNARIVRLTDIDLYTILDIEYVDLDSVINFLTAVRDRMKKDG